ncbi:MAG: hypothetical protein AAGM22_26220 [Acidobacteriota bacterium]
MPFLEAAPPAAEGLLRTLLVERAHPLVRRVVTGQLRHGPTADIDDVVATVLVRLTRRLRELRADPGAGAIESFTGYVAKASYNACHEWFRQKAPRRAALAARLRYLARRGVVLRLEPTDDGQWWCRPATAPRSARGETARLAAAVDAELGTDGRSFDDLIEAVAERLGEVDAAPGDLDSIDRVPHPGPSQERRLDGEHTLRLLWPEIVALPENQRAALLLNLRGPGDLEAQLEALGLARPAELAALFHVSASEAEAFLRELPREDTWIARRLGVTRRQVINLRKAARARLARRLIRWAR